MILRHKVVREVVKHTTTYISDAPLEHPIPSAEEVRTLRQYSFTYFHASSE